MTQDTDLAYLRNIAESGEKAPLLGGRFFLWWGGLSTLALAAHWMVLSGQLAIDPSYVGFIWMVYGIVGGIGSGVLGRGIARKPGTGSVSNRSERAVWNATGLSVFVFVIGAVTSNILGSGRLVLFDMIPLVAFAGYGIAFWVSASLGGPKWMRPLAFASWATVIGGLQLIGTAELYLVCAVAVFLLSFLPGLVLVRGEPAAEQ